jgi:hypothetical protein
MDSRKGRKARKGNSGEEVQIGEMNAHLRGLMICRSCSQPLASFAIFARDPRLRTS